MFSEISEIARASHAREKVSPTIASGIAVKQTPRHIVKPVATRATSDRGE